MPAPRPALRAAAIAAATLAGIGCGGTKTGDAAAFCADLEAQAPEVMNPELATPADVDAHVELYRQLAETVPLSIEEEWDVLLHAYETAASVAPGDAESLELARREIYSAEAAALDVRDWVAATCGFDLGAVGPIGTVAGAPATTTTVPGG